MISVDDAETNKKFAEQEQADFPMLSNPDRKVADAYGVLPPVNPDRPEAPRVARRWTFYIGPDGKILYIDKAVSTGTAGEDLARKLDELKVKKK
jgi:peroxiredoxin Q/BCP